MAEKNKNAVDAGMDEDENSAEEMEIKEQSSSSSDEEDDNLQSQKVLELVKQIAENPYMYDNHIQLIKLHGEMGEFDKLRSAREHMSEIFPLTEELWLNWIQDEIKFSSGDGDRIRICDYFERAIKDYLSVPLWLEYGQYSIGGMGDEGGISKIRDVFERALTAVGLHASRGQEIWEAYREFENAILSGCMPQPGAVATREQEDAFSAQHERISNLFKRQLSVPLINMTQTFTEYKDWMADEVPIDMKQSYEKTLEKMNKLLPFEDKLSDAEPPKLVEYQSYIEYEVAKDDPARIQCIFERAIQENCLVADLWLQYTNYLDTKLKSKTLILSVYDRGVRNCPWCTQLWINYILALERSNESSERIKGVVNTALKAGFSESANYLQLWTVYCDYLRRHIKWDQDHDEDLELFRDTIEAAVDYLLTNFGYDGDPSCSLRRYWAFVEGRFCKKMDKARELWNNVMTEGHGNEAAMWLEFFRLERCYGDEKHCRRVLQRAINSVTDWPESIVEAYTNYEREEGTLEHYDQAVVKCEAQMKRINERRAKEAEKEAIIEEKKKLARSQKKSEKQSKKQNIASVDGKPQKSSLSNQDLINAKKLQVQQRFEQSTESLKPYQQKNIRSDEASAPPVFTRKKKIDPSAGKSDNTVNQDDFKIPPPPGYKETGKSVSPPPGFKRPAGKSSSPPPGFSGSDPPSKKLKLDDHEEITEGSLKPEEADNDSTIFVSNISYSLDEDSIKEIFTKIGEIKEIRLIKDFKGRSKGYAYVEFTDKKFVSEALKQDRTPVEGRPMFVSRCMDRTQNKVHFKYATKMETNKLFIKNLPFTCTKEALETIFKEYGPVKDVRLVTYRSGAPKGLAFVEYEDETSAKQAILKTDGLEIGDHTISVAISNPPERKAPVKEREPMISSLGSGKKETEIRKSRSQILVPRSIQKSSQSLPRVKKPDKPQTEQTASTDIQDTKSSGMSNDDFRKMLLK